MPNHEDSISIPLNAARFFRTFLVIAIVSGTTFAEPPSFDEAVGSWLTAREWLNEGVLPEQGSPEANLSIAGLAGASVVLRLDGRTVGRAAEFSDEDQLIRRVLGRAMAQALGDSTLRSLPEAIRQNATSGLTLEIEFAGAPRPLLGSSLSSAVARIRPGIDGLAVRRAEEWAYAFPGRSMSTGTAGNITSTILRLTAELGLPPRDLPELRKLDDISLYQFDTLRIAQASPKAIPFEAQRSGRVVPRSDVTEDGQRAFAESLIHHLHTHRPSDADIEAGAPVFLGDFNPVSDQYDPLLAPPLERALVAWALAEAAQCNALGPEARALARDDAIYLLGTLQEIDLETPGLEADASVLAAAALVNCDGPNDPAAMLILQRVTPVLLSRTAVESNSQRIQHAAAIAAIPQCIIPAATDDAVRRWLDLAWEDATPELLVSNLDWYALAERDYARRNGAPSDRVGLLRDARNVLRARRENELLGNDLDGGIPLQNAAKHRIDARTLRLAVACAMLEEMEPESSRTEAQDVVVGFIRFARQLQMSEVDASLYRGGRRAIGGVREAPWSPKEPLAAEAMALLLVTQSLR